MGEERDIGKFELNGNPSKWIVYNVTLTTPLPERQFISLCRNYIVESNGKLLAVFVVDEDETPIHVFELSIIQAKKEMKRYKIVWHIIRSLGF